MAVSTWPDISHCPELDGVLRQMDQQVKWPQKMKAPDSFQNPCLWCDFHRDHGHKTEDCVAPDGEISNTVAHKSNQWRSREPPLLLPDYSEGKDQSLIAITEQTSGSTHRRTGGRRNGRRPVDRKGPDPPPQDEYPLACASMANHPEESQSEEISAIELDKTWMTPLIRYLENDILLEDHNGCRKIKKQAASYCISQEILYRRSFSGPYLRCVTPQEVLGSKSVRTESMSESP
ncbi:hypothetical protein F2Q68_00039793 [Brassica cretica]|uniref:Uncharacterized protein n=1 Tax=Brassica cretica TaxID=69181 RepID=A0A8S9MGZ7_BRACR|nr:hypothetical protein F2Q68_00039793 [Brassica cretica]